MDIPTQQDLMDAGCWFDSDRAGGREMTGYRREVRWRQHRWARDVRGVERFGTHHRPGVGHVDNGTKLVEADAAEGLNFLSDGVRAAVAARLAAPQAGEMLDRSRLERDLLSSMPMAFNLCGEAAGPSGEPSRATLARLVGVEPRAASRIDFEWSPGRGSAAYTRDRTAFDVALVLGEEDALQTVVGIETKLHEHLARENKPSGVDSERRRRWDEQTDFLLDLAERSGAFVGDWRPQVVDTPLRQVWRDHLLALSMRQHIDRWRGDTTYALVFPRRNASVRAAAEQYARLVDPDSRSYAALHLEDVVGAAFAHGGLTEAAFRERYLW